MNRRILSHRQARGPLVRISNDRLTLIRPTEEDEMADAASQRRSGEPLVVARNGRLTRRVPVSGDIPDELDTSDEQPLPSLPFGKGTQAVVALFVLSEMLPVNWWLGSVRISPSLLLFLVSTIPCTIMWLARRRTPIIASDLLMLFFCIWSSVAVLLGTGADNPAQTIGILFLQTWGPYLLARMTVRDAASMRYLIRCAVVALTLILPFALVEALTGHNLILQAARLLGHAPATVDAGLRWGLHRAQGPFEHPILMGVFSASIFSMGFYAFRDGSGRLLRWLGLPIPFVGAMLSLSTGALLAVNVQAGFMLWSRLLRTVKRRWAILTWGAIALYMVLDMFTTRSPIHTFVRYMTFSAHSSYNRILIWQYGSAEALRHPLFGIGLGDWERPRYMSSSMDNFWLVLAVRYGLPALAMFFAAIWIILRRMGKVDLRSDDLILLRRGATFSIVATMVAVVSVHLWNASYVWFLFLIGASAWMSIPRANQLRG